VSLADVEGAKPDVCSAIYSGSEGECRGEHVRRCEVTNWTSLSSIYWRSQIEEERCCVRLFVKIRGIQVVTVALQILMFLGREKERGQRGSVLSCLP